ncbi:hypothetical protein NQ317_006149, partial [Molorchus minor]
GAASDNQFVDLFKPKYHNDKIKLQRISDAAVNSTGKNQVVVRKFLKHYNSLKPITILVDDTDESHKDATVFLNNIFDVTPNAKNIKFSIIKFNSTGVFPIMDINGNNLENIDRLLNFSLNQETSYLGPRDSNGTSVLSAILNAASVLPQNGGILLFLDRNPSDVNLASNIGILRKKNIRVYVVWGEFYSIKLSGNHILREICEYSGGLFLVNTEKNMSDYNYGLFLENSKNFNVSTILSKTNLKGSGDFTFPIDFKITAIHIRISPYVEQGTLSSPTGFLINILKNDEITDYSTGSFGIATPGQYEVHLKVATPGVGFWRLRLNNKRVEYNVTVFVYAGLTVDAFFTENIENIRTNFSRNSNKIVKLSLSDYVTMINSINLVDQGGHVLSDSAKYVLPKELENNNTDNLKYEKEIDFEINRVSREPVYALIQGKDSKGHDFLRMAYVRSYNLNTIFPQPTLTIDVGEGSELITTGLSFPVILKIISPEETVVVRVNLVTKLGTYQDEIQFTASIGSESFTKKVMIDVGMQVAYDDINPELDYSFSSDCSKVVFSSCEDGTWTVKIKAKDSGSGLLQVSTIPKGIYFSNDFITGTRDQVEGYYSDSCCNPDLQITAVDRLNNRVTKNINAYLSFWGPAQIAALVLVALIIYLIVKCVKGRENYNLPTYRGGRI